MDYHTSNTSRSRLEYRSCALTHSWTLRMGTSPSPGLDDIQDTFINSFLNALSEFLPSDFGISKHEFTKVGELISIPYDVPATDGLDLAATAKPTWAPNYLSFHAKSSNGSKCKLSIYGVQMIAVEATPTADFRINGSEMAEIASAVVALNSLPFTGIDRGSLKWYNYANFGYNSHVQAKLRRG
jgi:hypothetical protein